MYSLYSEKIKHSHPYYKIMDLNKAQLLEVLDNWTRLELIDWLCWNDRNGVYKDEDSLKEFGNIVSKKEAIEIIIKQIIES